MVLLSNKAKVPPPPRTPEEKRFREYAKMCYRGQIDVQNLDPELSAIFKRDRAGQLTDKEKVVAEYERLQWIKEDDAWSFAYEQRTKTPEQIKADRLAYYIVRRLDPKDRQDSDPELLAMYDRYMTGQLDDGVRDAIRYQDWYVEKAAYSLALTMNPDL